MVNITTILVHLATYLACYATASTPPEHLSARRTDLQFNLDTLQAASVKCELSLARIEARVERTEADLADAKGRCQRLRKRQDRVRKEILDLEGGR